MQFLELHCFALLCSAHALVAFFAVHPQSMQTASAAAKSSGVPLSSLSFSEMDDGADHHVRVLQHWHSAARLTMELTQANMELLLRTPARAAPRAEFRPTITLPNIGWNKSRNALFCWRYDGSRWRNKSMIVKHHDAAQLRSVAHAVERQLSEWREAHHFTTNYDESYEHADAEEDAQNAAHGV